MLRWREYGLEWWFPSLVLSSKKSPTGPSRVAKGEEKLSPLANFTHSSSVFSVLYVSLPSKISCGGRKKGLGKVTKNCYGMYSKACF